MRASHVCECASVTRMTATAQASGGTGATDALEKLYPVTEVADLWECSPAHIYTLIAKGELRTVDLGVSRSKTRIPESALHEFVARRSVKQKTGRKPRAAA